MEEGCGTGELDDTQEGTPERVSSSHIKSKNKQSPSGRLFDFSKYNQRHIALKIAYLGWNYSGFVSQENTENTIEEHLFSALNKLRLIKDRGSCQYSRCGRTDKGVSALGQVIAVTVRSNLLDGAGVFCPEGGTAQDRPGDKTTELNYVYLLNRVLPEDIRVLAWCPVSSHFNARCRLDLTACVELTSTSFLMAVSILMS
jgi:tRNA pseudouridine38/39 synthase